MHTLTIDVESFHDEILEDGISRQHSIAIAIGATNTITNSNSTRRGYRRGDLPLVVVDPVVVPILTRRLVAVLQNHGRRRALAVLAQQCARLHASRYTYSTHDIHTMCVVQQLSCGYAVKLTGKCFKPFVSTKIQIFQR